MPSRADPTIAAVYNILVICAYLLLRAFTTGAAVILNQSKKSSQQHCYINCIIIPYHQHELKEFQPNPTHVRRAVA